jgi:tRNA-specific 2-thiouridylase
MKKVICAMSGGLDSSVATAILKRDGFDVIGVFMRFWSEPENDGLIGASNRCCSKEAEVRARKVAKILKIPFYIFDFSKEFKEKIVDYFLEGYKKGITPNPCVLCNKEIKFGLLLEKALGLGADFVATGHYARKKEIRENSNSNLKEFAILKGKDKNKDQSYFLWMLNQKQLKRVLFPIGDYTREEVENLAKKFRLPVLKARKSVEICFVKATINDFLKRYLKEKPGLIVEKISKNETKNGKKKRNYSNVLKNIGIVNQFKILERHEELRSSNVLKNIGISGQFRILAKHNGLWFYTIGQRKGIGLSGGPYWVLDKDVKNNLLIVTKNEKDLYKKELVCKNVNWVSIKKPRLPLKVKAKIRYKTDFNKATIYPDYSVVFEKPQRAITPGQSIVFYKGEMLLGGGIIS